MTHLSKVSALPAKAVLGEGDAWWEELFQFWRDPVGELLDHLPRQLPMISKSTSLA